MADTTGSLVSAEQEAERLSDEWFVEEPATASFWDRLGMRGDLPMHLPMGVNQQGHGPAMHPHHFVCWCPDESCPLTLALREQRRATLANIHISAGGRPHDEYVGDRIV